MSVTWLKQLRAYKFSLYSAILVVNVKHKNRVTARFVNLQLLLQNESQPSLPPGSLDELLVPARGLVSSLLFLSVPPLPVPFLLLSAGAVAMAFSVAALLILAVAVALFVAAVATKITHFYIASPISSLHL